MSENLKDFLVKIGVEKDASEKIASLKEGNVFDFTEQENIFLEQQKKAINENPEIVKEINKKISDGLAKEKTIVENKVIKMFGLSKEETKDLKIDQILEMGKNSSLKLSGTSTDELQSKLMEANNLIKHLQEEVIPNKEKEVGIKLSQDRTKRELIKILGDEVDFIGNLDSRYINAIDILEKGKVTATYNEDGGLWELKKGEEKLTTKDGTKFIDIKEFLRNNFDERGLVAKSNGNTPTVNIAEVNKLSANFQTTTKFNMPHLAKAIERQKEMEAGK